MIKRLTLVACAAVLLTRCDDLWDQTPKHGFVENDVGVPTSAPTPTCSFPATWVQNQVRSSLRDPRSIFVPALPLPHSVLDKMPQKDRELLIYDKLAQPRRSGTFIHTAGVNIGAAERPGNQGFPEALELIKRYGSINKDGLFILTPEQAGRVAEKMTLLPRGQRLRLSPRYRNDYLGTEQFYFQLPNGFSYRINCTPRVVDRSGDVPEILQYGGCYTAVVDGNIAASISFRGELLPIWQDIITYAFETYKRSCTPTKN